MVSSIKKISESILGDECCDEIKSTSPIIEFFDSFSFIRLLSLIEEELSIIILDEDFYENSIITIGDLSKFIISQKSREVCARKF